MLVEMVNGYQAGTNQERLQVELKDADSYAASTCRRRKILLQSERVGFRTSFYVEMTSLNMNIFAQLESLDA